MPQTTEPLNSSLVLKALAVSWVYFLAYACTYLKGSLNLLIPYQQFHIISSMKWTTIIVYWIPGRLHYGKEQEWWHIIIFIFTKIRVKFYFCLCKWKQITSGVFLRLEKDAQILGAIITGTHNWSPQWLSLSQSILVIIHDSSTCAQDWCKIIWIWAVLDILH